MVKGMRVARTVRGSKGLKGPGEVQERLSQIPA